MSTKIISKSCLFCRRVFEVSVDVGDSIETIEQAAARLERKVRSCDHFPEKPDLSCEAIEKHLQTCNLHPIEKEKVSGRRLFQTDCIRCGARFVVAIDRHSSEAAQRASENRLLMMANRCDHTKPTNLDELDPIEKEVEPVTGRRIDWTPNY